MQLTLGGPTPLLIELKPSCTKGHGMNKQRVGHGMLIDPPR
jgi:hypothetical protein